MTQAHVHIWEDMIDDEIRQIYMNYEGPVRLRQRPALLCIDNYNMVFGDRPQPVLESIKRFPSSCGLAAWDAIMPTKQLMSAARELNIPVIHTAIDEAGQSATSRVEATKRKSSVEDVTWAHAFFCELEPDEDELVVYKPRASAFYGTSLATHLVQMDVNTLIVCGNSTSGCIRASVADAYSAGYNVVVVEESVFDRSWLSHKVSLFDMDAKYADVMFLDEVLDYFESLEASPDRV